MNDTEVIYKFSTEVDASVLDAIARAQQGTTFRLTLARR